MPETKRPLKVFLCHASIDKPKVRELYRYLRRRGVNPWFDEEHLIGGQDWQVEIPKALATSDAIIICLTRNSIDKEGYIQKEIKFALDKALEMPEGRIFLIPVKFEECEVPFTLSRYQWVDLTIEAGYSKMMKALKFRASQLERTAVELPKTPVAEENFALEKSARETAERDVAEQATQEKATQELKREVEKIVKESKRQLQKVERQFKWKKFFLNIRSKLNLFFIDVRFYFLPVLVGVSAIALLVYVFFYMPRNNPIQNTTPTSDLILAPQPSLTSTEAFTPTEIFTLSATPLPVETADAKGVEMALVPAGDFIMGSNADTALSDCQIHNPYSSEIINYMPCNRDWFTDEEPIHQVYLDTYYIDKYEVTNSSYATCVADGSCIAAKAKVFSDNEPVVFVDWYMAQAYCKWRGGSLPTEAQWEKAARGNDGRTYPWGESIQYDVDKSPYGIYNTVGNHTWEWVADWYDKNYYKTIQDSAVNSLGPDSGVGRVLRGGSWLSNDEYEGDLRVSTRSYGNPDTRDSRYIGFRCAKSVP